MSPDTTRNSAENAVCNSTAVTLTERIPERSRDFLFSRRNGVLEDSYWRTGTAFRLHKLQPERRSGAFRLIYTPDCVINKSGKYSRDINVVVSLSILLGHKLDLSTASSNLLNTQYKESKTFFKFFFLNLRLLEKKLDTSYMYITSLITCD